MKRVEVITKEITWLIPKLLRGLRAGFIAAPQLSTSQMVTLMRVYEKATISIGDLSKQMHVSAPTVTGVIDRLVRNGYIRRTHDKIDRRKVNVELTNKGSRLVKRFLSEINKRWYKILMRLAEKDREDYLRILKRIVEVLTKEYA